MLNFTTAAIRIYRQIFGTPELAGRLADGIETVLDGNTAIAVTEACITEVAALGGGFLEQGAALAWLSEQQRINCNLFAEKLTVQQADSARGALASAMGVTLSGHRSTLFLGAQDLSTCQDLLQSAAGRRLPLVVHLELRLSARQGVSPGSGHDAVHQAMDSGCFVLFAANVQQAVDFTLIARHVAEITMTPAVVVVDSTETAQAIQDVRLPSAELVKQFIGAADESVESPSVAQKQLFSDQKRRVQRWHNMDKPLLQGALVEPQIYALGDAAGKTFFDDLIATTLEQAFVDYARLTGRSYSSLSGYALKKADIIVVAQGSAIETLKSFSDLLKTAKKQHKSNTSAADIGAEKMNIGIIGLHSLRPFDTDKLIELLRNNKCSTKQVVVLERTNISLADDAPLMREIRAAIHKAAEHKTSEPKTPDPKGRDLPQLHSIIYGLGGTTLAMSDLLELFKAIKNNTLTGRYLGIPFTSDAFNVSRTKECHPKRQVMIDTLQRYYPQINELGVYSTHKQLALLPDASDVKKHIMSFAISHLMDAETDRTYAMELSSFIHKINGGYLRSSTSPFWQQWAKRQTDYIIQSAEPCNTADSSLVNFFIAMSADAETLFSACECLNSNGILIFSAADSLNSQPAAANVHLKHCLQLIKNKNLTLYKIDADEELSKHNDVAGNELLWEKALATLIGVLVHNNLLKIKTRRLISTRQADLAHVSGTQQEQLIELFKLTLNNSIAQLMPFELQSIAEHVDKQSRVTNQFSVSNVPEMVKKLGDSTDTVDSLPRFWDQIGVLHQTGETDQLTADPYLATGTMPSLTATFNDMSQYRHANAHIPIFNPLNCTACGACWSNCPDSAIAVAAITPKALLETGIRSSGADSVRPIITKLASRIAKHCRNNEHIAANAGELLDDAFAWFKEKSGMAEDRLKTIEHDFIQLNRSVAALPVAATDLLFHTPEKKQNDSGELFSLVINPDSCKACGLCVQLCFETNSSENCSDKHSSENNEPALSNGQQGEGQEGEEQEKQTQEGRNVDIKQQWQIWQQIPDTSSATIERIIQEQSLQSGAALMLSRHNAFSLSGGDQGEPGSGEKIAMRHLLSAVEYHQQPLLHLFIKQLEELREKIKQEINSTLSLALPTDNLQQLSAKLSDIKTRQIDLNALLTDNTELSIDSTAIDAVKTSHLVNLVLQLNDLHWKLSQGNHGLGRARYSLCITSSSIASWAAAFPYNPFHVPVTVDVSGESAQLAAGLVHGQVNELLSAVSLMRQARANVDARYAKQTESIDKLNWTDLTEQEKQLCPPLLLVGGDDLLATHGFSQVSLILNSNYPVKVVIFNELDSGLAYAGLHEHQFQRRADSRNNLAMMALSQRNAYVAQTSIADSTHLQQSVHELLSNNIPGLLCIHTPSPSRHGFRPEHSLQQAELAVKTRMFPLFRYNPQHEGVFGSRLCLDGNAENSNDWLLDESGNPLTPAHWAINEQRFKAHFSLLSKNAASPAPLHDWLKLSSVEQEKKTPYIVSSQYYAEQKGEQKEEQKVAVSEEFAAMIIEQQNAWRTLQELAGIVTPFTDYVEQVAEQRLSSEHQAELDALRVEYEEKIKQLEDSYNSQTHAKIRNQLLGLAGYDVNKLN